ncbi:unnamed protein product [Urochloa decumbens]|uniref:BURP domain-containing protein n=1 Tax=Urochloa decumbens TaxID=240449 RepID=A0ABC9FFN5_9POAL
MHPSALLLLLTVAAAAGVQVCARPADGTPAARFWEQALQGSPMPEAVADLVEKGIDHSPLLLQARNTPSPGLPPAAPSCSVSFAYGYGCHGKATAPAAGAAATGIFFREEEARVGSTMEVYFPEAGEEALPGILPRAAAATVPFADSAAVLARFSIAPGSGQAAAVAETLRWCREEPPLAGERKACATSLEATVGAATRMLSAGARGMWSAASALSRGGGLPRAAAGCHATAPESSRALVVTLSRGLERGGPEIAMVAVCHLDTSGWNPEHPAFKVLNTKPGGAPVCHFMPYGHLVFGVKAAQP